MKPSRNSAPVTEIVPATSFQAVTFYDPELKKQVIMLYTLGQDGIVREFSGTTWKPFPILKE
jgi:hypothetical protein